MDGTPYYPYVVEYTPTLASTGMSVVPEITVRFSLAMEASQFTDPDTLNSVVNLVEQSTGTEMGVEYVSYDSDYYVLTLQPTASLTPGSVYQVTIAQSVLSMTGRSMLSDAIWNFLVDGVGLLAPTLGSPADNTAHSTAPDFTWAAVDGASTYGLQIASNLSFASGSCIFDSSTSELSVSPDAALFTDGTIYHWRVYAEDASGNAGPWSDVRSLYYGARVSAAVDSRVSYPHSGVFGLTSHTPAASSANNSSWPVISATFSDGVDSSTVTDVTFVVEYEPVEGDPLGSFGEVAGTLATSGTSATFTPTDTILPNTRYTVVLDGIASTGGTEAPTESFYFTSNYVPLYARPRSMRARYRNYLQDFSDDDIYFHIYQASLLANEIVSGFGSVELSALQFQASDATAQVVRYVELRATFTLLQIKRLEVLEEVDRQVSVGDFSTSTGSNLLDDLQKLLNDLEADMLTAATEIGGGRAMTKSGVRSSKWSWSNVASDKSLRPGMIKTEF